MPYLPVDPLNQTTFPKPWGKDLSVAISLIEERYRRHYTNIQWHSLKIDITEVSGAETTSEDLDVAVGSAGTTKIDPLYGEAIDPDDSGNWQQPHLSGDTAAAAVDVDLFDDPVELFMRVQRETIDLDLKLYGFDRVRDLLCYVPLSFFDKFGLTVHAGDYFVWDGDPYDVLQFDRVGYWKNTNLRLYMLINAEHRRHGS